MSIQQAAGTRQILCAKINDVSTALTSLDIQVAAASYVGGSIATSICGRQVSVMNQQSNLFVHHDFVHHNVFFFFAMQTVSFNIVKCMFLSRGLAA